MSDDPMVRVAWAERPTGPLSNLYLTSEQANAVHDWLADVIARVRREEQKACGTRAATWHEMSYDAGRLDALDAAREAVEKLQQSYQTSLNDETNKPLHDLDGQSVLALGTAIEMINMLRDKP